MMEICNNGIDDDGDGLVDCFDSDCFGTTECASFYYGSGTSACQFVPPVIPNFELELVYRTDVSTYPIDQRCSAMIGDLDGDGIPEIVGKDPNPARIQIFNGIDGSIKQSIVIGGNHAFSQVALADVDRNGFGDIFVMENNNRLARYEYGNPAFVWKTDNNIGDDTNQSTPQVADFDGDGVPEVYVGNRIFNSLDGTRLAIGNGSRGRYSGGDKYTIAFDVFMPGDPNPSGGVFGAEANGLELIAGNQVYTVELGDGTMDNGTLTIVAEVNVAGLEDGFTSIADIDNDGAIDVVVMDSGSIYIWNPRTENQIGSTYAITNTNAGGRINLGDFDNDGMVEIGTAGRDTYVVLEYNAGSNTLEIKWQKTGLDDGSQRTGSTLFDFEGDGSNEVVYREEGTFYVWNGADGMTLFQIGTEAGTRTEYPIVADVNGDGAAEVILTAQNGNGPGFSGTGWVEVYRSKNNPWVSARPVWNQHGYFNTNINDDLTVPAVQQNPLDPSFNGVFNAFLQQSTILSNGGAPAFAAPDASIELLNVGIDQCPNFLEISMKIKNEGDVSLPGVTPIAFYDADPTVTMANLIGTTSVGNSLDEGDSTTVIFNLNISAFSSPINLYGVVNDTGFLTVNLPYDLNTDFPVTGTPECDFSNNLSSFSNIECLEICGDGIDNDGDGFADEPNIIAPQTDGCTGEALPQMTTDLPGGTWGIISSIGTTIDANGNVVLGTNNSPIPDIDTVFYLLPECNDTLLISTFDDEAPILSCPGNQVLFADINCTTILADYTSMTTISDNCGATFTQMPISGTPLTIGLTTITMTAIDDAGNTSNCSFTVNTLDNTNPIINCPSDLTVNPNSDCEYALPDYSAGATYSDNCSLPANINIIQFPPVGYVIDDHGTTQTVSLTAQDERNNQAQCFFQITLEDNTNPTIICPADLTADANIMCEYPIPNFTTQATIADNCTNTADLIVTQNPLPGFLLVGDGASTTVTLQVEDGNGGMAQCSYLVTIVDLLNPTIVCPGDRVANLDGNCEAEIDDYTSFSSYTDNCVPPSSIIVNQSPLPGMTLSGHGTTQLITLTADDGNGNITQCSFNLSLEDNLDPNLICPTAQNLLADGNCEATIPDYTSLGMATDNCVAMASISISQIPISGTIISGANAIQAIILTAEDGHGNFVNCNFNVQLQDPIPPSISCPADMTVDFDENCAFEILDYTDLAIIDDNCQPDIAIMVTQVPNPNTIVTMDQIITLTADDGNGNSNDCSFNITIIDNIAPEIICPNNQTITTDDQCEIQIEDYTLQANPSDNCTAINNLLITQTPVAGTSLSGAGTNQIITITIEDEAGNTNNCTLTIALEDNSPPSTICPNDQVLMLDNNCQAVLPDYSANGIYSDNCTIAGSIIITQLPLAGTVFSGHGISHTITLTADDGNGNTANCSFSVALNDNTNPSIVCPTDVSIAADINCAIIIPDYRNSAAADNCTASGAVQISQTPSPGTSISGYNTIQVINLTADDGNGNFANCNFNITINDVIPPVPSCPADITFDVDASCNFPIPDLTSSVNATDNCSLETTINISQSPVAGTIMMGNGATSTITMTATDEAGNDAICDFIITINDAAQPSLICPSNQTDLVDAACNISLADYTSLVTVTDNCATLMNLNITQTPIPGTLLTGHGTTQTVTISADDGASNIATCDFEVSLIDNTNPSITCPSDVTVTPDPNCQSTIGNYTNSATTADNCALSGAINVSQDPPQGTVLAGHNTQQEITLTADDGNGNSSQCMFNITLQDNTNPIIICPDNKSIELDDNCSFPIANYTSEALVTDNCAFSINISVNQSPVAGTLINGHGNSQTITLTADDGHGNTAQCSFDLLLNDVDQPTLTCPNHQNQQVDNGCEAAIIDYRSLVTISDNCTMNTAINLTQTPPIGSQINDIDNPTIISITADDGNGNMETCSFELSLIDAIAPDITCPNTTPVYVDENCQILVEDYRNSITLNDNCDNNNELTITQNPASGTILNGYNINEPITINAADLSGNVAQCAFEITLTDTISPSIICPNTQNIQLNAICEARLPDYTNFAAIDDNCTPNNQLVVNQNPAPNFLVSGDETALEVILTVEDATGNSSDCQFVVNFQDVRPPTLQCPPPRFEALDNNCQFILPDYTNLLTTTDECQNGGAISLMQNPSAGSVFVGVTELFVVCTATDSNGNAATCQFLLNIEDLEAARVICPNNKVLNQTGCGVTLPDYRTQFTSNDACGLSDAQIAQSPPAGTLLNDNGDYLVTFSVEDSGGNITTCDFTVSVVSKEICLPVEINIIRGN